MLVKPVISDRAVVALDISILLWIAGLDEPHDEVMFLRPACERMREIFRAIITPDSLGLAPPLNNLVETTDPPQSRKGQIHLNAKPFAVKVINHVERSEGSPIGEPSVPEVH